MRLAITVVWVLTQYHDLDRVEGGRIQRTEVLVTLWKNHFALALLRQKKCLQRLHIGFIKLSGQMSLPAFLKLAFFLVCCILIVHDL